MNERMDHPAVETLRSFLMAMKGWGEEMIQYYGSLDWDNADESDLRRDRGEQRKRLESIFEAYCEAGLKAKRLRDEGMAYDLDTPEYDPDHQPMESVLISPGKVIVETRQTNKLRWRFRYELIPVG